MTKNTKNALSSFTTRSQVANYLQKTLIPVFQHKNKFETLKNKLGTKPRNKVMKHNQKNFKFDPYVERTHITFEHVQSHK